MTKVKLDDTEIEFGDEYVPGRDEFDYLDYYNDLEDTQTIDIEAIQNELEINGDNNE